MLLIIDKGDVTNFVGKSLSDININSEFEADLEKDEAQADESILEYFSREEYGDDNDEDNKEPGDFNLCSAGTPKTQRFTGDL